MKKSPHLPKVTDGAQCKVVGGVHVGKSGIVRDLKAGKTGFVAITVVQADGERFKTLAKMSSSCDHATAVSERAGAVAR